MKSNIKNESFVNFVFRMFNEELKKSKFRAYVGGHAFERENPEADDKFEGLLILVDEDEVKIYPSFYKSIMKIFGLSITEVIILLEKWANTELPKKMVLSKKYFKKNEHKEVNVEY